MPTAAATCITGEPNTQNGSGISMTHIYSSMARSTELGNLATYQPAWHSAQNELDKIRATVSSGGMHHKDVGLPIAVGMG